MASTNDIEIRAPNHDPGTASGSKSTYIRVGPPPKIKTGEELPWPMIVEIKIDKERISPSEKDYTWDFEISLSTKDRSYEDRPADSTTRSLFYSMNLESSERVFVMFTPKVPSEIISNPGVVHCEVKTTYNKGKRNQWELTGYFPRLFEYHNDAPTKKDLKPTDQEFAFLNGNDDNDVIKAFKENWEWLSDLGLAINEVGLEALARLY